MYERHGDTKKHGRPRLYRIWVAMRQRCNDPKRNGYARYGGRGIKVCEEWDTSFLAFKTWALAHGYQPHLSIDRDDVNGNYEPSNCRWATQKEQMANTHRSCLVEIDGKKKTVLEWSRDTGISWSTLYKRFHRGVRGKALVAAPQSPSKGARL